MAYPQPVFHPLEGRAECVRCHLSGQVDARALTPGHEFYAATPCVGCHARASAPAQLVYAGGAGSLLVGALGLAFVLRRARLLFRPARPRPRPERA